MEPAAASSSTPPSRAYISLVDIPLVTHISKIRCGSYTTEWIARAVGLHPIPANKVLKGPIWFDVFRPILPTDMRALFKFRGMDSVEVDLRKYSDAERIEWIKREVAFKGKPPALLVRTKVLHWIAIGGYDDQQRIFYIYDSRYGFNSIDPSLPIGNNTIGYDELARIWRGRWWLKYKAIVITNATSQIPTLVSQALVS